MLADIETFGALEMESAAVITAVTAQNSERVSGVHPLDEKLVIEQAAAVIEQGLPLAVKIGMLGSKQVVQAVAGLLDRMPDVPLVVDPVVWASAGAELLAADAIETVRKLLFGRATIITPNAKEAGAFLGRRLTSRGDIRQAAGDLFADGPQAVVVTGGDRRGHPVDVLCDESGITEHGAPRIRAEKAPGTGCRFSSALAVGLAHGLSPRQALQDARRHVRRYLRELSGS